MMLGVRRFVLSSVALCCLYSGALQAQVNVTTQHNDNSRTGQNIQETILTPSNVNSTLFGQLYSLGVDGYVYAQPLYMSGMSVGGVTHNVLYVATEHDSVYAIDADTGAVLVQKSLIPVGGTTVNSTTEFGVSCADLVPEIGITGTPVIDPTTGTLYVVAKSKVGGNIVQYLHALDTSTLSEKFGAPVLIAATATGTGTDGSGGIIKFNAKQENQRPALLLDNGHVIISWAGHCDIAPWHGWVMSYSASSLVQEAVLNLSPNGNATGVWMSGGGLAADASGNIFFATGNGSWDGITGFGDSIVKLGIPAAGKFPVLDYFTPWDQASLSAPDTDVGSGGLVLLPTSTSGKQFLAQMGKQGKMYVLDRTNLGRYCPNFTTNRCTNSDTQIPQEIAGAAPNGVWGVPSYWNGTVYWSGDNDKVKAFSVNASTGLLSTAPATQSTQTFGFPGVSPSVSANGTTAGILWGLYPGTVDSNCSKGSTCEALYAYDAANLGTLLYSSNQAAGFRDALSAGVKFATPTVVNGKVFVAGQSAVYAFGLLTAVNPAASPAAGGYATAQLVTLSDPTPGAIIYYTLDGTTPTATSMTYASPLSISTTTTMKAFAVAAGYANSGVTVATYTIAPFAASPTVSPAAGTYITAQNVTLSDAIVGAAIYYTTDGSPPTTAATLYSTPLSISSTTTINALAVATGYNNSAVTSATFTISTPAAAPTFSPAAGTYSSAQSVSLSDATPGAVIYFTIDGTTPTIASTKFTTPVSISATTTIEAIAVATGYTNSAVGTATFTINIPTVTPPVTVTSNRGGGGSLDWWSLVAMGALAIARCRKAKTMMRH